MKLDITAIQEDVIKPRTRPAAEVIEELKFRRQLTMICLMSIFLCNADHNVMAHIMTRWFKSYRGKGAAVRRATAKALIYP